MLDLIWNPNAFKRLFYPCILSFDFNIVISRNMTLDNYYFEDEYSK